jgi:hypothetical protein
MDKLLLDITTIITLISDTCNDQDIINRFNKDYIGTNDNKNNHWTRKSKLIYEQILNEIDDPILPKLNKLFEGSELFVTKSGLDKANYLITSFGSKSENENLKKMVKRLIVIDDDPSDRINNLSKKYWTQLNKNIFGTADKYSYKVVTGNIGAITNLLDNHMLKIEYIAHRSRCFVGKKFEKNILK